MRLKKFLGMLGFFAYLPHSSAQGVYCQIITVGPVYGACDFEQHCLGVALPSSMCGTGVSIPIFETNGHHADEMLLQ